MFEYAESNSNAYMQWAARQVKWKCKVEGHEETISDLSAFALDPGTLRTGWGKITKGEAPDFVWADVPGVAIPRPSDDHKAAFTIQAYVTQKGGAAADGWVEWRTNAAGNRQVMKKIDQSIHDDKGKNAGKAVLIKVTGAEALKMGPNEVMVPTVEVQKWIPMPAKADAGDTPAPAPAPAPAADDVF